MLRNCAERYPIFITRRLADAKRWLKDRARGSERYGIIASSEAQSLKPHAVDVRSPIDPVHWFLDDKDDVRSSYYLERRRHRIPRPGPRTGLGLRDVGRRLPHRDRGWEHWSFCGNRWNRIQSPQRKVYLKNAYRVLLTRASRHGDLRTRRGRRRPNPPSRVL